jgi:hypothetical protein
MPETHDLHLQITHPDLVLWLDTLPPETRDAQAERTLAIGHQVLTMIEAGSSEEAMRRMFRPVTDTMGKLQGTLDVMMNYASKSQRLGELGEATVAQQLQTAFPNDRFAVQSDTGHQGDVQAEFDLGGVVQKAIIEVKLYTGDVPKVQLDKFRSDLKEQRQRYGLMVSLTSRFTGIHRDLEIEARDGYLAVFVANAGLDGDRLYWGALLLKSLMAFEHQDGRRLRGEDIERAWETLRAEFQQLEQAAAEVGRFREAIRRAQAKVNETLDGLVDQAISAELRLKTLVEHVAARVSQELGSLQREAEARVALPPPFAPDEVRSFMDELDRAKDKRAAYYRALWLVCEDTGLSLCRDGDAWVLVRDGKALCRTVAKAQQLDLAWSVEGQAEVSLKPELESLKANQITIASKDPAKLMGRLRERLAQVVEVALPA